MKSKSPIAPILGVLLAGSLATNGYLYTQNADKTEQEPVLEAKKQDSSVSPTYNSITFDEAQEMHSNYVKERAEGGITKSIWVNFDDLQNYIDVVKANAEPLGQPHDGLGMRIYFTRYANDAGNMQDNLAFIPGNMIGGEPSDWPEAVLRNNITGTEKTFLMNRHLPCPLNCGKPVFK